MNGQMTFREYRASKTLTKDGVLRDAPEWVKAKTERCELCRNWIMDNVQPPDGWGIYGFCNRHRGSKTDKYDLCQDFEEEP